MPPEVETLPLHTPSTGLAEAVQDVALLADQVSVLLPEPWIAVEALEESETTGAGACVTVRVWLACALPL